MFPAHRSFWRALSACLLFGPVFGLVCGCTNPAASLTRISEERGFKLPTAYEFIPGEKPEDTVKLGRGFYQARYADGLAFCYYEAPFSQNAEVYFSGARRGGICVEKTPTGSRAFLYVQQNTMTSAYVQGGMPVTYGGDNRFVLQQELPPDFLSLIQTQLE